LPVGKHAARPHGKGDLLPVLQPCLLSKKLGQSTALSSHAPTGETTATPQGGECASAVNPAGVARRPCNLRS